MEAELTWTPTNITTLVGFIGAGVAFVVGLLQYRTTLRWKRAEWVAQEMKTLFNDPCVQAALLMFDWGARRIPLFPTRDVESERFVFLTDDEIAEALEHHESRKVGFTEVEAEVRFSIDRFLDGIERFSSYEETGLVTLADLAPYLRYWADKITGPHARGPEDRLIALVKYMDAYGYSRAFSLLRRVSAMPIRGYPRVTERRTAH